MEEYRKLPIHSPNQLEEEELRVTKGTFQEGVAKCYKGAKKELSDLNYYFLGKKNMLVSFRKFWLFSNKLKAAML